MRSFSLLHQHFVMWKVNGCNSTLPDCLKSMDVFLFQGSRNEVNQLLNEVKLFIICGTQCAKGGTIFELTLKSGSPLTGMTLLFKISKLRTISLMSQMENILYPYVCLLGKYCFRLEGSLPSTIWSST